MASNTQGSLPQPSRKPSSEPSQDQRSPRFEQGLLRLSLGSLPYLYYISLLGLFTVLISLIAKFRHAAIDRLTRNGFLWLSLLLLLSSAVAYNRGEAFLQLTHFLPFFLFFAFVPFLLKGFNQLEQVATDLVISTIPINLISLVEYILKSPFLPRSLQSIPYVHWLRGVPQAGRAMVTFDHPNALASYLVLILGLGLGLILKRSYERRSPLATPSPSSRLPIWLIYLGTYINLVGIFSSGSRNGFLIAISQLVIFSLFVKTSRVILLSGVASLAVVVAGATVFGIGGRALSVSSWTDDPRVAVWQIAIDLMGDRPWLGWGLGSFKLLYPPRAISAWYPEIYHPHNFWLLLGAEAGVVVMVLLTFLVGYICFRTTRRMLLGQLEPSHQGIAIGYLLAFWGCVGFALLDITFYDFRINILNWVILAGIYVCGNRAAGDISTGDRASES